MPPPSPCGSGISPPGAGRTRAAAVNEPASPVRSLARPEILTLKPVFSCRLAARAHPAARQRGALAAGRRHDARGPQPVSRAAAAGAGRSPRRALRRPCADAAGHPRQRRGHRRAVAHLSARGHGRDHAMHPDFRHVPGRRPHSRRGGHRGSPRPRPRLGAWTLRRLLAAWQPRVKLVYLCSPNNPTGNSLDRRALEAVCGALDGKAMVVIDEAYIEWSRAREPDAAGSSAFRRWRSCAPCPRPMPWPGRASARCSATRSMIELAKRVIPPYCLAQPTIEAALRALRPAEIAASRARLDGSARGARISGATARRPRPGSSGCGRATPISCSSTAATPSVSCAQHRRRHRSCATCAPIRRCPIPLRVSVGTRAQNDALLAESGGSMSGATILFLDRDGTLNEEPPDEQVDSLEKIRLMPGVIPAFWNCSGPDSRFVMVTNQDGLGTPQSAAGDSSISRTSSSSSCSPRRASSSKRCSSARTSSTRAAPAASPRIGMVEEFLVDASARQGPQLHDRGSRHGLEFAANLGIQGLQVLAHGGEEQTWARHRAAHSRRRRVGRASSARPRRPTSPSTSICRARDPAASTRASGSSTTCWNRSRNTAALR